MAVDLNFFAALRRMVANRNNACAAPPPIAAGSPSPSPQPPEIAPDRLEPPDPGLRRVGPAGIALIKSFEGCARRRPDGRFDAYPDPATGGKPWTIGWGATGADIVPGLIWTQEQCNSRLARDLVRYAADVVRAVGPAPTTDAQFDALVSFHYNTGAIFRATLTRLHRSGDYARARGEFGKWVNAGGRRMAGLVRRRAAEAALYARRPSD